MTLINSFSDEYEEIYSDEDIEELESLYFAEQEYIEMMNAYETITANINYYAEDQLQNLLDLINRRIQKDS